MPRSTKCSIGDCDQPPHGKSSLCHEHLKAYNRDWARQHSQRQPKQKPARPTVCPICGKSPEEAARWAALNVFCTHCRVSAAPLPVKKPRKKKAVHIVAADYSTNTVKQLAAQVTDEQPMPATWGELQDLLKGYEHEGALIAAGKVVFGSATEL